MPFLIKEQINHIFTQNIDFAFIVRTNHGTQNGYFNNYNSLCYFKYFNINV